MEKLKHPFEFYIDITIRLIASTVAASIIGLTREKINRPAGIRTHALIAVGSCIVTILSIYAFYDPITNTGDPGRLAAQIVSGIGFLGAGTILKRGMNVKGLTTAAALWSVAAIGIAYGAGEYFIGTLGAALIFFIVTSNRFYRSNSNNIQLSVYLSDSGAFKAVVDTIKKNNFNIKSIEKEVAEVGGYDFTFFLERERSSNLQKLRDELLSIDGVNFIEHN